MAELYGFAADCQEASLLFEAGVRMVQFRNKRLKEQALLEEAIRMRILSERFPGSRLIVNDSLEIALAAEAWGVHLGQDDGDFRTLCKTYGGKLQIGVSVDTVAEAQEAEAAGADYIGAGAVFGSRTKPEAPYMGLSLLSEICNAVSCPVSAIGGINLENLPRVIAAGPEYICVISDIHNNNRPEQRVREFIKLLMEES